MKALWPITQDFKTNLLVQSKLGEKTNGESCFLAFFFIKFLPCLFTRQETNHSQILFVVANNNNLPRLSQQSGWRHFLFFSFTFLSFFLVDLFFLFFFLSVAAVLQHQVMPSNHGWLPSSFFLRHADSNSSYATSFFCFFLFPCWPIFFSFFRLLFFLFVGVACNTESATPSPHKEKPHDVCNNFLQEKSLAVSSIIFFQKHKVAYSHFSFFSLFFVLTVCRQLILFFSVSEQPRPRN